MNLRRCLLAGAVVAFACGAMAAPAYHTSCLERLARAIGLALPDTLSPGVDNDSTWSFRGRTLRIRTNSFGDVSHIGYKLFDTRWAATSTERPVLDFVERYALEEDVLPPEDKAEFTSRLPKHLFRYKRRNDVRISWPGVREMVKSAWWFKLIARPFGESICWSRRRYWSATCCVRRPI